MLLKVVFESKNKEKIKKISKYIGGIPSIQKENDVYILQCMTKIKTIKHLEQIFHNVLSKNKMIITKSNFYYTMAGNVYFIEIKEREE